MTSKPKYEIGQEIFWASFSSYAQDYVTCPDCGGTARLRVTFHDETTVSIPCANCARGYEPPTGKLMVYCRKGIVNKGVVSGMEIGDEQVEYRAKYYCTGDDGRLFSATSHIKEGDVFLSGRMRKSEPTKWQQTTTKKSGPRSSIRKKINALGLGMLHTTASRSRMLSAVSNITARNLLMRRSRLRT